MEEFNIKNINNNVLWSMISDISKTISQREIIPPSERGATFKETSNTWYSLFKSMVCEADDRMPDCDTH